MPTVSLALNYAMFRKHIIRVLYAAHTHITGGRVAGALIRVWRDLCEEVPKGLEVPLHMDPFIHESTELKRCAAPFIGQTMARRLYG